MKQTPSNGPRRELALVIPALDPGRELPGLLARLRPDWAGPVVVVDDGSGRQAQAVFAAAGQLGATVLHHGGNRGKGAALKTALRYCRTAWPGLAGCVTADADGQHSAADILRVADALRSRPGSLVLGVRDFSAPGVPLRSRLGNRLACGALRLACGLRLADTQTGLRGIPMDLVPELTGLPGSRYEFETAMLLAAQSAGRTFVQVPIATVYADGNRGSHFRPLADGLRVWAQLAGPLRRFAGAPLAVCLAWAGLFPLGPAVQAVAEAPVLAAESRQERILSRRAAGRIRALGQKAPRVWVITANDGGAAQGRIEYDLLPLQLPAQASILMADPPEGAPWAREISAEEWSRELAEGFDYVYIYCPEDQFVRDYLAVFEPGSQSHVTVDQMFRVIPQADGTARLRWLPE